MPRLKADDAVFRDAKKKLGELIGKSQDVKEVVALCEALTHMKEVELQADEDSYGSALGDK